MQEHKEARREWLGWLMRKPRYVVIASVAVTVVLGSSADLHRVLAMAQGGTISVNEMEYGYSAAEIARLEADGVVHTKRRR